MTKDRYDELMFGPEPQRLTPQEMKEGWHFCNDYDGLLVDPIWIKEDRHECTCFREELNSNVENN